MVNTEICNMAISHLGSAKEIEDLETEKSQEASVCRRFYDTALAKVLRDYPWNFSTKFANLALETTFENYQEFEYHYAYRYPTDCVMIRRILSGARVDTDQSAVPFRLGSDNAGQLIYSDMPLAKVEYTFFNDEADSYPPDFVMAFSYLLASMIAPRLTNGDPFKLGATVLQKYFLALSEAQKGNEMERRPDEMYDSEFIRVRDE